MVAIGTPTVGTYTEFASGTSATIPYPATVAAGACLVICASQSSLGNTVFTTPGGWTQVAQLSVATNTILPATWIAIKPNAVGNEGGTNLTLTHATGAVGSAQILAFPGVDITTPQDVTATTVDTNVAATTTVLPAQTIVTPGAAQVVCAGINSTAANATPPAGFTETGDRVANTRSMEIAYITGLSPGTSGTRTVDWGATSAKSVGILLALRPSSAPIRPSLPVNRAAIIRASF